MTDSPLIDRLISRAEFEDAGGCCDRQMEDVGALLREAVARLREAEEALRKIKAGERHVHDGEEYVILLSAERCRDIAVAALGGSA